MAHRMGRIHMHICPFYIMATGILVLLEISGRTGERYKWNDPTILPGRPAISKRTAPSGPGTYAISSKNQYIEGGVRPSFETRAVQDVSSRPQFSFQIADEHQNDHTPYVFISYTKIQFRSPDDRQTSANYQLLYALAIEATRHYAHSIQDEERRPRAFWLDMECLQNRNVGSEAEQKKLTDLDVSCSCAKV
jgi:hypothetical protein